jgi:hypothetical protein
MATTPSSTSPAAPTAAAAASGTVAGGKEAADILKTIVNLAQDHNDLATKLVGTYKELIFNLKGTTTAAVQFKNFSKEILRDSESRETIEQRIRYDINKQKDQMIGLRLESIKYANSQDEAAKVSADAQATETLLKQKNNVNWANLSHKDRIKTLAGLKEEYEKRKTNISHLSETEQIAEVKRRARLDATFDRMQKMSATELKRIGYVKFSTKLIENIQKTDENRANTNQKLSELYEKQAKQKKEEIKLNEMLLTYTKMQAGVIGILEKNSFAALGPLSGMVKNSVDFVGVWKKAGKEVAIAQLSMVAIQGSLSTTVKLFQLGFERFKNLAESGEKFRYSTGFTNVQTQVLDDKIQNASKHLAEMGITAQDMYDSTKAITDVFGTISSVSEKTLISVSEMQKNLGVAAEDSANILATFKGLSGFTEEASIQVMNMTARLSQNAGVSFSAVMKDVANASDDVLTSIGAYPPKLIKAAVAARQMGLDLNKVGSQQKRLLDYTSSITDELEASALLGKNITFMKARQLAFEGKSAESMAETLDVVKKMGKFNEMTPYQRAAVAKAAGMELKDLTKALAVDNARLEIMTNGTAEQRKQYELQAEALKKLEDTDKLSGEALLKDRQREITQRRMQSSLTNFKNTMAKLALAFADMFKPVFDLIEAITPAIEWVANGIVKLSDYMKKEFGAWGSFVTALIPTALALGFYIFSKGLLLKAMAPIAASLKNVLSESVASGVAPAAASIRDALSGSTTPSGGGAVRGPDVARGVSGAAEAARTEGRLPSTGGSKFVTFMSNIHDGLKKITPVDLIKLTVVGAIFAGMTYLIFKGMQQLQGVDWATLAVASAALGGFIYTVATLGPLTGFALKPIALLSAGLGILALGLSPFVYSFYVIGEAAKDFGEGMQKSATAFGEFINNASLSNISTAVTSLNSMGDAFKSLSINSNLADILILETAISKINRAVSVTGINSVRFGNGMKMGVKALKDMKEMDFKTLNTNISNLGKALGESSGGFFTELVNKLFGIDNLSKMEKLSNISAGLAISAEAIKTLMNSMQDFAKVDSFATAIDKLATSLSGLNTSIRALDMNKLGDVAKSTSSTSTAASTTQTSNTPPTQFDTTKLEAKIDELAKALYARPIQLYLDSKQISSGTAKANGL